MAVGDDILRQMQDMAFDPLAPFDEQSARLADLNRRAEQAERAARGREAAIVRGALATPAGAAFLAWLRTKTIELPASSAMLGAKTAEEYALLAVRREGASQVYFTILEAMAEDEAATEGEP